MLRHIYIRGSISMPQPDVKGRTQRASKERSTRRATTLRERLHRAADEAPLASVLTLRYKVLMNVAKRVIAATELLLIFPAALFMMALFVRDLQPPQYG